MPAQFVAAGAAVSGTGSVTVAWPTHLVNDIAILVIETDGLGTTLNPTGWTHVTGSPFADVASAAGSKLHVLWRRATSTAMGTTATGDSGDHQVARIYTFRGAPTTGSPFHNQAVARYTTASNTGTIPATTASMTDLALIGIISRPDDSTSTSHFGVFSNSATSTFIECGEAGTNSGNGGGFKVGLANLIDGTTSVPSSTCTKQVSTTGVGFTLLMLSTASTTNPSQFVPWDSVNRLFQEGTSSQTLRHDRITAYFDAHNGSTDWNSAWSNESLLFDGSKTTGPTYTWNGVGGVESMSFALIGNGTNAPTSSSHHILNVNLVLYGVPTASVYETELRAPVGGWTWEKIRNLSLQTTVTNYGTGSYGARGDIFLGDEHLGYDIYPSSTTSVDVRHAELLIYTHPITAVNINAQAVFGGEIRLANTTTSTAFILQHWYNNAWMDVPASGAYPVIMNGSSSLATGSYTPARIPSTQTGWTAYSSKTNTITNTNVTVGNYIELAYAITIQPQYITNATQTQFFQIRVSPGTTLYSAFPSVVVIQRSAGQDTAYTVQGPLGFYDPYASTPTPLAGTTNVYHMDGHNEIRNNAFPRVSPSGRLAGLESLADASQKTGTTGIIQTETDPNDYGWLSGSSAPKGSGFPISQVRARILYSKITPATGAREDVTTTWTVIPPVFASYPVNEWTWERVRNLQAKIYSINVNLPANAQTVVVSFRGAENPNLEIGSISTLNEVLSRITVIDLEVTTSAQFYSSDYPIEIRASCIAQNTATSSTDDWSLVWSLNGGTWTALGSGATDPIVVNPSTTILENATTVPAALTTYHPSAGTRYTKDGTVDNVSIPASQSMEFIFSAMIKPANLATGTQYLQFVLVRNGNWQDEGHYLNVIYFNKVAAAPAATFTLLQQAYYEDGPLDTTPELVGSQAVGSSTPFQVRIPIAVGNTGGSSTDDYELRYSVDGGASTAISPTGPVAPNPSSSVVENGTATPRLVESTRFAVGSKDGIIDNRGFAAGGVYELVYGVLLQPQYLSEGVHTLTFSALRNGAAVTRNRTNNALSITYTAVVAGGNIKVYTGSAFTAKPVKYWNGTTWVAKPVKRWNGTSWVQTPY